VLPELFRLIGSDRYLTADEVARAGEPHPALAAAWGVYATHFRGFTGSQVDPDFARLAHPAARLGRVRLQGGTTVLVVGSGRVTHADITTLTAIRHRVRVFTSARGAAALREHGITPDLIVVESSVGAARHVGGAAAAALGDAGVVAADWRTPAALLRHVRPDRLFVPSPSASWGLWPGTAVAMAADAGAARIALLGFGHRGGTHAPLVALLELMARLGAFVAIDASSAPTPVRGWVAVPLAEVPGVRLRGPMEVTQWHAPTRAERATQARAELTELAPILDRARRLVDVAGSAREMNDLAATLALEPAMEEVMGWRHRPRVRALIQETLGASFLPRLWRAGVETSPGPALRRPLLVATHEVTRRAAALTDVLGARRAA
jgi:hypothetical protein